MRDILSDIIEYKRYFVEQCKSKVSAKELETRALQAGKTRDFAGALSGKGCSLIAEIKTASPSKGIIREHIIIEDIAKIFKENGAACISVLTDEKYFQGNLERVTVTRLISSLPVLRKDFIIDPYQIVEARSAGADAILLIVACLDEYMLTDFIVLARSLKMDCLVEVHDRKELDRALAHDPRLIGINNRNLRTFETDISLTGKLAVFVPSDVCVVSESGIHSADDVRAVHRMGAHAVLIGEAIMTAPSIAEKVRELAQATNNVYKNVKEIRT